MGQEPDQIRQEIEDTRSQMGDTVQALSHKANVPGRIKESIGDKTDRLRQQMSSTTSKVSDATPGAGDIRDGAQQAVGIAQENPLGLAIGGVALGFLVGLALPTTRVENERIGPIADDVKETVKETGQEALDRGKQVAQDAASAATDAVKESGQEQAQGLRDSVQESVS
jgi:Protein of unknown function (DUF3618)